jgi:hypothetical protein
MRAALEEAMTKVPLEQATPGIKAHLAECIFERGCRRTNKLRELDGRGGRPVIDHPLDVHLIPVQSRPAFFYRCFNRHFPADKVSHPAQKNRGTLLPRRTQPTPHHRPAQIMSSHWFARSLQVRDAIAPRADRASRGSVRGRQPCPPAPTRRRRRQRQSHPPPAQRP